MPEEKRSHVCSVSCNQAIQNMVAHHRCYMLPGMLHVYYQRLSWAKN